MSRSLKVTVTGEAAPRLAGGLEVVDRVAGYLPLEGVH